MTGSSKVLPAKVGRSVRLNASQAAPKPMDSELAKFSVPHPNAVDAELSGDTSADYIDKDMRYVRVGYRLSAIAKRDMLACEAPREHILAVGRPGCENFHELNYTRE